MADLEKREEYEEEMMMLLLLIWASDDIFAWINQPPSIRFFAEKIQREGITDIANRVARQQTDAFLEEIQWDIDLKRLRSGTSYLGEQFEDDLARRLSRRHRDWLDDRIEAEREGIDPPAIEEIYTESDAKRESVTSLTTLVSQTEMQGKSRIKKYHGVEIDSLWQLDRLSNWCQKCMSLSGTPEEVWSIEFPFGPPAHPNCVLPWVPIKGHSPFVGATKAFYSGKVVEIRLESGAVATVTENHPIPVGGVVLPARFVERGNDCFSGLASINGVSPAVVPHDNHVVSTAEETFAAIKMSSEMSSARVPVSPEHFHGDGKSINNDICVVYPRNLLLGNAPKTKVLNCINEFLLSFADNRKLLHSQGLSRLGFERLYRTLGRTVGMFDLIGSLGFRHSRPVNVPRLARVPVGDTVLPKPSVDERSRYTNILADGIDRHTKNVLKPVVVPVSGFLPANGESTMKGNAPSPESMVDGVSLDSELFSNFRDRNAGLIKSDRVVDIRVSHYSGPVYDFEASKVPFYNAGGIWVHNCRCYLSHITVLDSF